MVLSNKIFAHECLRDWERDFDRVFTKTLREDKMMWGNYLSLKSILQLKLNRTTNEWSKFS